MNIVEEPKTEDIPVRRSATVIVVQSCIIALLFYQIGGTYDYAEESFPRLILQYVLCPLSVGMILAWSLVKAQLPANRKILKDSLKAYSIIMAILIALGILLFLLSYSLADFIKSLKYGRHPGL